MNINTHNMNIYGNVNGQNDQSIIPLNNYLFPDIDVLANSDSNSKGKNFVLVFERYS